jgi:hypothetical protein
MARMPRTPRRRPWRRRRHMLRMPWRRPRRGLLRLGPLRRQRRLWRLPLRLWMPSGLWRLPSRLVRLPMRLLLLLPRHLRQLLSMRNLPARDGFLLRLHCLDAPARCPLSFGGFGGPAHCTHVLVLDLGALVDVAMTAAACAPLDVPRGKACLVTAALVSLVTCHRSRLVGVGRAWPPAAKRLVLSQALPLH